LAPVLMLLIANVIATVCGMIPVQSGYGGENFYRRHKIG